MDHDELATKIAMALDGGTPQESIDYTAIAIGRLIETLVLKDVLPRECIPDIVAGIGR